MKEDLNYIDVRRESGEVVASIPMGGGDIIVEKGLVVAFGYGEASYEDINGKVYAIPNADEKTTEN